MARHSQLQSELSAKRKKLEFVEESLAAERKRSQAELSGLRLLRKEAAYELASKKEMVAALQSNRSGRCWRSRRRCTSSRRR